MRTIIAAMGILLAIVIAVGLGNILSALAAQGLTAHTILAMGGSILIMGIMIIATIDIVVRVLKE